MNTLRAVGELREVLGPARRTGRTIGLVPTMGALHEGHLSLIAAARAECEIVVVSLFVNPAQFDEGRDLERYPRQEEHDRSLAEQAGADFLFVPTVEEVYPTGFATRVEVFGLTDRLEGQVRGTTHFRGVTTVVTKLLNMVLPDVAYFGQKDAQQVAVISRLVTDLNMAVRVAVCPTVREPDGLALSSRNAHLDPDERRRALALHRALSAAATAVAEGERDADRLLRIAGETMARANVKPEYLELADPDTFEPVGRLEDPALLLVAARVDSTRLIDNVLLCPVVAQTADAVNPPDTSGHHETGATAPGQFPVAHRQFSVAQPIKQASSREAPIACSA
jgi:pantoate--beta-alanine ligase